VPLCRLCRSRFLIVPVAALLVIGLAAPHVWAWSRLRAARGDLARYHPEPAQAALASCLTVWPENPAARLLASRAARQAGDFEEADRQLRACQRAVGGTTEEIAFEWAMLQAAAGSVQAVEDYLNSRAEQDPTLAPLAWEALAEGYLRVYRILDAMTLLKHWLEFDPNNVRALELRGITYVTGKGLERGSEDFRRVLELDPGRDKTRWLLVRSLLGMGSFKLAADNLEWFDRKNPGDPEVLSRLARCYNMLGRGPEARQMLDTLLEKHPDHGVALRTRGMLALTDQQPAEAERWLRRATKQLPDDYQSQWFFAESLRQQDKTAEAKAQLAIAEQVRARSEKLSDFTSKGLADKPLDPALRYEMGLLLIQTGQQQAGVRWIEGALVLDPGYKPAHATLADYYERTGDTARAADHRRQSATE
jgi:tetratricopeptide (TPR) repeat protein